MTVKVYAHRGYSGRAMENSMTAFRMAKKAKVDGIELDVHVTRDGEVVVIHDERLDRTTTGTGWLGEMDFAQIEKYSLLTLPHESVPRLADVLELFVDTSININVELKNQIVRYPSLIEKVVQIVEYYQMEQRIIVSSFYHPSLVELKTLRPTWNIAPLIDCVMVKPWEYVQQLQMNQLHLHYTAVEQELVDTCRKKGVQIRVYTVNEEQEMCRLVRLGVDAIITNYPSRLRRVIDRLGDTVIK